MNSHQVNVQTILIVDDVPDNLHILYSTLTEQGYQVRCANNGYTALFGVQAALPDLILLDVKMPDMNGYEVCQQLKATERTRDIPVIFLSDLDELLDKVRLFEVGGVDYITKPFEVGEVLARVKSQLALLCAKAEIYNLNAVEQRTQQHSAQLQVTNQQLQTEIAERKLVGKSLQESEERFESILSSLDDIVWSVSVPTWKLLYLNSAAQKVYGRSISDFLDNPNLRLEMVHPEDRQRVENYFQTLLEKGSIDWEYRILRPDGEVRWLSDRTHVIYDRNGIAIRLDGILYDITQRKQAEAQLIHDALHDVVTCLPNRTLFTERVESALQQAKRRKDYLFAVLFIDLNRFKIVNDSLGHSVGDQLLIAFAQLLKQGLRTTDTIARLRGDEFTILLDDIKDITDAVRIAERLQKNLLSPFKLANHTVFTSASIGIVLSSTVHEQAADLLRDANTAMYRAKERGTKTRYAIFDFVMYDKTLQLLHLESDLRRAIECQEFCLHYQPITSLVTGKLIGFEALVRWQHPERGLIFPTKFISITEDTGLIIPLGEWVLHEACRQMHAWQMEFPTASPLNISVNLASKQIKEANFIQQIELILAETGLDGSCLKLEITEGTLMEYVEETINTLLQIKAKKIQLSIDDFGQGYSSLSYLHRFPIDTLKIDRSFVSLMNSDNNFEIVRTITTLAHTLGMDVIAEGVETSEQLAQLKGLGCEFGQGYFFSKPLNGGSAQAMIAANPQW